MGMVMGMGMGRVTWDIPLVGVANRQRHVARARSTSVRPQVVHLARANTNCQIKANVHLASASPPLASPGPLPGRMFCRACIWMRRGKRAAVVMTGMQTLWMSRAGRRPLEVAV